MRILITGFFGFVSNYLVEELINSGEEIQIIGVSRSNQQKETVIYGSVSIINKVADLNDSNAIRSILADFEPEYIFHLASDSSVSHSWEKPVESFQNNTNIFLNLIECVRTLKLKCRVLSVGSSEEYGIVDVRNLPLAEETPLNPISPYAVARVSQELLSKVYTESYSVDIILTRSFNHIGPRQKENFVISSFAKQIAQLKAGQRSELEVGNLSIIRDFLDVRDVVRAYILLMKHGQSGQIYNVCSGTGFSLKEILTQMLEMAGTQEKCVINENLTRPSDNPVIIGNNQKIFRECNWAPSIPIEESLRQILEYWQDKLQKA